MRRVALCLPYYRNQQMLREQLTRIAALPLRCRENIEVLVCDDGSPDGDAQGFEIGCVLRIFKIGVDVRWNQDAARNVCAHFARAPWLLLTDMDHLVPAATWNFIQAAKLNPRTVYRFGRDTWEGSGPDGEPLLTPYKPHPNTWLMSAAMYWEIGGYDERFAGLYGTDALFREEVRRFAGDPVMLGWSVIRVPRETIADASTVHYERKVKGVDDVEIPRRKIERDRIPNWRPLTRTFPYKQIYP